MKKIAKLGLNVLVLALAGLLALTGCSAKSAGELTQTILQAVTLPESYSIAYEVTDAAGGIRTVKKTVDAAGNVYFADGEQELLFLRQQDGTYLDAEGTRHTAQAVDEATAAFADCAERSRQQFMPGMEQGDDQQALGRSCRTYRVQVGTESTGIRYTLIVDAETGVCMGWQESAEAMGHALDASGETFTCTEFVTDAVPALAQ